MQVIPDDSSDKQLNILRLPQIIERDLTHVLTMETQILICCLFSFPFQQHLRELTKYHPPNMSTRRKGAKKDSEEEPTLTKEQDAVARYVRFNCPTSTTMFQGNEVHYFTGSKAIDILMESKYGSKAKNEAAMLFPNRQMAVNYMRDLLSHQLFFRARKLVPKKKDDKEKRDKDTGKSGKSEKDEKKKKEDETVTETEAEDKKEEKKDEKKTKDSKEEEEKKKKKKVKLELHDVQVFNDDKDVYVWIFDPTPLYKKVIGLCMEWHAPVACSKNL
ncbi:hypothetical protein Q1695_011595 [Nippostrongylus brasiliensis]|nr:hypothetical protein Q1695_011595 [Nippostrongylus brasiliensis]